MRRFVDLLQRFRDDQRGAFLALFGIAAVVLIATAGATVDFTSVQQARTRAQVALDAAALALQPHIYDSIYNNQAAMESDLRSKAEALMLNRLNDAAITASVTTASADKNSGTLTLTATLKVPLYFVALVGVKEMNMTLVSQATKGSQDLEVAVALDVTGSMSGSKISALKTAATSMIDILVLDQQTPTYSKMALVPWSMGVNVGSYANSVRGTPVGAKAVTGVTWQIGSSKNISGITKANPAVVTTSTTHGLTTGDIVYVSGITSSSSNWLSLNGNYYTVTVTSTTKFKLDGLNSSSFSGGFSSGTIKRCSTSTCDIVVTSNGHGLANGTRVFFTGVGGTTSLNTSSSNIAAENPTLFTIGNVTTNTFQLMGSDGPNSAAYTSGGSAYCVEFGCEYYDFPSAWSGNNLHQISTCVTERVISPDQYTDTAPSTTQVGLNYPSTSNPCLSQQIVPLTSDKTTLKNTVNNLVAEGSTAGQTGLAWTWFMLSPNFSYLFPSANRPAPYLQKNLMKVLVLMTDGSFNTVYCNGVIAKDSTSGSGSAGDQINCNATNGNPFTQSKALCDKIKAASTGIIVYTVGFDIAGQTAEQDMLSYCATDKDKFYLADDATALNNAFKAIAQDIATLRITQ